eukprot:1210219-Alexandrium_andersonii.AAC.1
MLRAPKEGACANDCPRPTSFGRGGLEEGLQHRMGIVAETPEPSELSLSNEAFGGLEPKQIPKRQVSGLLGITGDARDRP